MDDELFDVFDESAPKAVANDKGDKKSRKRSINGDIKSPRGGQSERQEETQQTDVNGGEHNSDEADVNGLIEQPNQKRPRLEDEPEAVITDTFETEQSREIAASAGLQAQNEGQAPVVLRHQVRHQAALPPDLPDEYVPLHKHKRPEKPAREYNFQLDPFQEFSIAAIERNESVLVSAHTSAGKTVVAEYAIAQCLKNNQRVIYTSPIKALSNQKCRDFEAEFGDVGLMTGDTTKNPDASCVVMTTEILRSMLYRGSEMLREVAWVIFDEAHYLRDKERGVVWEETMILLPDKVRYVFLSATIPNAMQFAEWICKTHSQPCHVIYTDFRPTPLQHYFFPAGADGIHLVVDEKGVFREENFNKAMSSIAEKGGDDGSNPMANRRGKGKDKRTNKGGRQDGPTDIYKIVKMVMMKKYNPVIVFSFSKRECENYALQMSQLAFNDQTEKDMVQKVFDAAMTHISAEDRELPQIQHILPLLRRGIGIHHGGLLPILKETIEILFQEGLIKVLFATETFSIGLNMPAKTVIFTSVRKFDGTQMRWLSPTEFIQMSGRAGRRGIDDRGIVIMMVNEAIDPNIAKNIVRGEQDKLNSAFYLNYNMILNLMRVEGINPEFLLERCFYQFQNAASVSGLQKQLEEMEQMRLDMFIEDEEQIKDYYNLRQNIATNTTQMKAVITDPQYLCRFLQPGRLVKVKYKEYDFGWGIVVNFIEVKPGRNQKKEDIPRGQAVVIDVCINVAADALIPPPGVRSSEELPPGIRPPEPGEKGKMEIVPVLNGAIDAVAKVKIWPPNDLRPLEQRNVVRRALEEISQRFPDGIAVLDPIENMGIKEEGFVRILRKIEQLEHRLLKNPLHKSDQLPALYDQYAEKVELSNEIKAVRKKISDALSVLHLDELKNRKRVLRRLGFINDADVVQMKARVACEISTGDELMLSELLFNRFFNELTPEQCAALLSVFICDEKGDEQSLTKEELAKPYRQIKEQARVIAKISTESKIVLNEEQYVKSFKMNIMEVVYAWAHGATFATICKMTDIFEGNLIRLFKRLEELLRQMAEAAKVIGNEELKVKFEEANKKVDRNISSVPSLYT